MEEAKTTTSAVVPAKINQTAVNEEVKEMKSVDEETDQGVKEDKEEEEEVKASDEDDDDNEYSED